MKEEMLFYTKNHRISAQVISEQTDTHITLVNSKRQLPKKVIGTKKPWYGICYFYTFAEANKFLNPHAAFETQYMMLDRLRSDCRYFIDNGKRNVRDLWAGSIEDQIEEMRKLYALLPEKPEWLTEQQIDELEKEMLAA